MKPIEENVNDQDGGRGGRMKYVFGPVASRRLGLSLGVDLVPRKCCSYDCIYCQVGRTTMRTLEVKPYLPSEAILEELGQRLDNTDPDVVTLSGSGEPTLHGEIGVIIKGIKSMTSRKVAILTNGSLLWNDRVRRSLLETDIIMPTLSTARESTFRTIHRPHPDLQLPKILEGLELLRKEFKGFIGLEIMLISGINDGEAELKVLKKVVDDLEVDQVQLNTVVRPPADASALALEGQRLEEIREFFGANAAIISHNRREKKAPRSTHLSASILEVVKRRPLRAIDVADALNAPLREVEAQMQTLVRKGELRAKRHADSIYYTQ
ncbi:MAG: radical SAM protein [Deltaproteobacteria bacterium]|nr:radical SAM protein [Deltaproteobacteria bacterium]